MQMKNLSKNLKILEKDHNISALINSKKDKIKYFYHERSALNTVDANLVKRKQTKKDYYKRNNNFK